LDSLAQVGHANKSYRATAFSVAKKRMQMASSNSLSLAKWCVDLVGHM
jgi:hypothetical protein